MNQDELFTYFHDLGIVPVVKIDDAAKAVPLAKAMIKGGIPCAEVTFRTAAAEQAIKNMSKECPEMLVGAGTVTSPELAEKAIKAGAKFIVSPGLNPATVEWCLKNNVPVTPGVCTPSEIEKGLSYGLKVLKFFPAEASGGVGMLKNFAGPFGQVKFMTTGGISTANIADYAKASNVLAIGGSWMVKGDLIEGEKWDEITKLCNEARAALQGFTFSHIGINNNSEEEALKAAKDFEVFGLTSNIGNSSIFMDKIIEVCKKPFPGKCGHLAIKCYDLERAIYYLKGYGIGVDEKNSKKDDKGKYKVVYLDKDFDGFAVHLIKG